MSSTNTENPESTENGDTISPFFLRSVPPKYPLLHSPVPYIFNVIDQTHLSSSSIGAPARDTFFSQGVYTSEKNSNTNLQNGNNTTKNDDTNISNNIYNKRTQNVTEDIHLKKRKLSSNTADVSTSLLTSSDQGIPASLLPSAAGQNKTHIQVGFTNHGHYTGVVDSSVELSIDRDTQQILKSMQPASIESSAPSVLSDIAPVAPEPLRVPLRGIPEGFQAPIVNEQPVNKSNINGLQAFIGSNNNGCTNASVVAPYSNIDGSIIANNINDNDKNNTTAADAASATYPLPSPSASPIYSGIHVSRSVRESTFFNHPSRQSELIQSDSDILQIITSNRSLIRNNADLISQLSKNLCSNSRSLLIYKLLQSSDRLFLSTMTEHISNSLRFDIISNLPDEINKTIFSFLDFRSLLNVQLVCKNWALTVNKSDSLWSGLILKDELVTDKSVIQMEYENMDPLIEKYYQIPQKFYSPINQSNDVKHTVSMQCFKPCIYKLIYKKYFLIDKNWSDLKFNPKKICLKAHGENVITCLQFDHERIVTGADDKIINVFDTKTGRKLLHLAGHEGGVWGLKYIGNTLITASTDKTLRLWNLTTGKCIFILKGHTSTVRCLDIIEPRFIGYDEFGSRIMYPKRPVLVSGSRDYNLHLWDLSMVNDPLINKRYDLPEWYNPRSVDINDPSWQTKTLHPNNEFFIGTLRGHTDSVRSISVYGRHIVSGSYDASVRVWDLETLSCVHILSGHTSKVYTTAIDPYRQRVLSGSLDATVNVWDLYTGQFLMSLEEHDSLVGLIQLSEDYLVTAAADSTVRIWDPVTGICKHTLKGHDGAVTCFQNNNKRIVSGSAGLVVWDVRTGSMIRRFNNSQNCNMWQVKFNDKMCISAVQRNGEAWIEVLDFESSNFR